MAERVLSKDFFWRRIHSLTGLWLVLFVIEHLLTNSQSALLFGDDGIGFIKSVNFIHNLPYLPVIEVLLLAVPFLIHGLWGIKYAWEAKFNSGKSDGSSPALGKYKRNKAFTWQRITSWILLIGVIAHVAEMRFMNYPEEATVGSEKNFMVRITDDTGLKTLAARLDVALFSQNSVDQLQRKTEGLSIEESGILTPQDQELLQEKHFVKTLASLDPGKNEVIAVAKTFGTATLLVVRDTFKMPMMIILYSIFVIAASYHAFNGLWTSFITWGVNLSATAQKKFLKVTTAFMVVVAFLGLASVWLTYLNLRY